MLKTKLLARIQLGVNPKVSRFKIAYFSYTNRCGRLKKYHVESFGFFKFGEQKFMSELLRHGTVYMNTVDYFYHYEQDNNRGDKYEGTSFH